jgi:hypothetical protein
LIKNLEKMIMTAALAASASALLPLARDTLRPSAQTGYDTVTGLVQSTRSFMRIAREEVEDIVAEAQFERMKKQLDREIAAHGNKAK